MTAKTFILRFLIMALIGLGLGVTLAGVNLYFERGQSPGTTHGSASRIAGGTEIGGPFTLVNHKGETVTRKDYADKPRLIYFGFTYCPSICPTELQKMARALETSGADEHNAVYPLFITVDPERDTPEAMAQYVEMFHPDMIGLTGSPEQIEQVKDQYKIYASKVQTPEMSDYTMDHSSFIYLMGKKGALIEIFRLEDTAREIADALREHTL